MASTWNWRPHKGPRPRLRAVADAARSLEAKRYAVGVSRLA